MSVESLLLLVLLIVLPLLERLVRALRARTGQRPEKAPANPPPPSVPSPVLTPPARPSLHPAAERVSAGERVRRSRTSQQAAAPTPTRGGNLPSRARLAFSLSKRADARRAMLLVAILGPCKALEGEAGSVPGGAGADVWRPR